MYSRILIATDGSELASKGIDQGIALAKQLGSEVTIVTVTEPWTAVGMDSAVGWSVPYSPAEDYDKAMSTWAAEALTKASERAASQGVVVKTVHVPNSHPAEGIVALADRSAAELIVMASHGRRGLGRLLLGSQATQVLSHAKVPVLIVK